MYSVTPAPSRRLATAAVTGALIGSGLLFATPAHAAAVTVPRHTVDLSETRATGHNDFGANGVRVWTEGATSTDKAAGYFDVHTPLADAGEPSMAWTPATPAVGNLKPSVQLKTDFDGDGNIDGILVGEPTYADGTPLYGDDWWLSNGSEQFVKDAAPSHEGGSGSANHGTLAQWRTAFEDAVVIQGGWSMGSGAHGDGTIASITVGDDVYTFADSPAATTETLYEDDVDLSQTRAKGHNDFLEAGGVRIHTEASDGTDPNPSGGTWYANKAAGYFPVGTALADAGEPAMDYEHLSGLAPSVQLVTDFDGDGEADGILVGERGVYGKDWWLSNGSKQFVKDGAPSHVGGSGSENHGLLSEWRAAFPDAQILHGGWSLGSGAVGEGDLHSITVGLTQYAFTGANRAPVAEDASANGVSGGSVTVDLEASDPDGDELTVSAPGGAVDGTEVTFAIPANVVGVRTMPFTVTDGQGGSDVGTIKLTITPARSSSELVVRPEAVKSTKRARAVVKIESAGRVTSGRVVILDGDDVVGTGRLATNGKVVIQLKKLSKGKHKLVSEFAGTRYAKPSKTNVKIIVK